LKPSAGYIAGALACLALQGWLWYDPLPAPPVPQEGQLAFYSRPADAQISVAGGSGRGLVYVGEQATLGDLSVSRWGYETRVESSPREWQGRMLELRPALWLQLLRQSGWMAALLCLGLAWARRPRPEPGPCIGPYRLEGEPLKGSMGEVYRAQAPDGSWVAVKLIRDSMQEDPEFRARFQREAQICQALHHPHVVKPYGSGVHEGRIYMAQEWIEGTPLSQQSFPLPREQAWSILRGITLGLQAAHAQNIVHRDLKAENVLLRPDGQPVIVDFGLARGGRYGTITKTATTLGTPGYMPPEQVLGERSGPQADLYSLGCLAFLLLTGRLPFEEETPFATMMAHVNQPAPEAGLDPAWDRLLRDLLQKDPKLRPAGAAEVLRRLESLGPS